MTRKLTALALLAAVIYGGLVIGAINTLCQETGPDW